MELSNYTYTSKYYRYTTIMCIYLIESSFIVNIVSVIIDISSVNFNDDNY